MSQQFCSTCGKEIVWKKTKAGKSHPFDAGKTLVAVRGTDDKTHVVNGHVSHFATCPQASQHSRRE